MPVVEPPIVLALVMMRAAFVPMSPLSELRVSASVKITSPTAPLVIVPVVDVIVTLSALLPAPPVPWTSLLMATEVPCNFELLALTVPVMVSAPPAVKLNELPVELLSVSALVSLTYTSPVVLALKLVTVLRIADDAVPIEPLPDVIFNVVPLMVPPVLVIVPLPLAVNVTRSPPALPAVMLLVRTILPLVPLAEMKLASPPLLTVPMTMV